MSMFIEKVPTVVSLSQMLEDYPGHFCSPEDPISDCDGRSVPMIVYPFSEGRVHASRSFTQLSIAAIEQELARSGVDGSGDNTSLSGSESPKSSESTEEQAPSSDALAVSLAEKVLCKEWDRRFEQGLFRYDVKSCTTKAISETMHMSVGNSSFTLLIGRFKSRREGRASIVPSLVLLAQLNVGRASKKRATEFRIDKVVQPFDATKFNFQKAAMKEVLFQFTAGAVHTTRYLSTAKCGSSPNLVLINVSPIEYGHILLVPRVNDCIPQVVDQTSLLFALQCTMEVASPYFRLGYNSLGAFGTINHLHFQGYFLEMAYPVERAPTVPVEGLPDKVRGVHVERLQAYPVHGWVFSGADNVDSMASLVGAICMQLQLMDVPHNLLLCDIGSRVFLWPQCYAEKLVRNEVPQHVLDTGVNPAAFEIAGHMVLKREEDYNSLSQDTAWNILKHVSLSTEAMDSLEAKLFAAYYVN